MSIFCLENRIMCLDDLDRFLGVAGKVWVAAIAMQIHADACRKACMFALFGPQTYLPTLDVVLPPHARTYLPTLLAYRSSGPTYYEKTYSFNVG